MEEITIFKQKTMYYKINKDKEPTLRIFDIYDGSNDYIGRSAKTYKDILEIKADIEKLKKASVDYLIEVDHFKIRYLNTVLFISKNYDLSNGEKKNIDIYTCRNGLKHITEKGAII